MTAEITKYGIFDTQVCVPKEWTDKQVLAFVNTANPSGLDNGWHIKKEGDESLSGDPERNQCTKHEDNVHIMLNR